MDAGGVDIAVDEAITMEGLESLKQLKDYAVYLSLQINLIFVHDDGNVGFECSVGHLEPRFKLLLLVNCVLRNSRKAKFT